MKHLLLFFLLVAMLSSVLCLTVSAALSPGLACIAQAEEMVKSGLIGSDITFTDADFRQALGVANYEKITIHTLPDPSTGTLKLGNLPLTAGQTVLRENIGRLTFTPASDLITESSFVFSAGDVGGGTQYHCRLRLTKEKNSAPTVTGVTEESLSVWTQKNISVFGTMTASDPENDQLTYYIVSYPEKGTLVVTDRHLGDFRYTPVSGYTGRDSFSYVVRDEYGQYSGIATVQIKVASRAIDLEFTDMEDSRSTSAALRLTEEEIMQGTLDGEGYCFYPEESVSRASFVVMLLKAAGITPEESDRETFYDDNDSIPVRERPYVACAARMGLLDAVYTDASLLIRPSDAITQGEAALMVQRLLALPSPSVSAQDAQEDALTVLSSAGILPHLYAQETSAPLNRGGCAELLLSVLLRTE